MSNKHGACEVTRTYHSDRMVTIKLVNQVCCLLRGIEGIFMTVRPNRILVFIL